MTTDPRHLDQLTAYLDGELTPAERADVERLLDRDPAARSLLSDLRKTARLVAALPRAKAPTQLAPTISRTLDSAAANKKAPAPFRHRAFPRWAARFAAAAVLAIATITLWSNRASFTGHRPAAGETIQLADKDAVFKKTPDAAPAERRLGYASEEKLIDASTPSARTESPSLALGDRAAPMSRSQSRGSAGSVTAAAAPKQAQPVLGLPVDALARADTPVELRLRSNTLTNRALLDAPAAAWSNQLIIESDPDTNSRLIACVNKYVGENRIPDAKSAALPDPIPSSQTFYFRDESAESAQARANDDFETVTEPPSRTIFLNLSTDHAADLFANLQTTATATHSDVNWIANGEPLTRDKNLPEQVVDSCGRRQASAESAATPPRETEPRTEADDADQSHTRSAGGAAHDLASKQEAKEQSKSTVHPTSKPAQTQSGLGGGRLVFGGGASSQSRSATTSQSPVEFITLALNFRSIQSTRLKSPTTAIISAAKPATQPTASQPAPRGPPGG